MSSLAKFAFSLVSLLALGTVYGYKRAHYGIDLTDEGSYVAFPLRLIFGERLFSSELMTLEKPFELILYPLYKLDPSVTLVDIRLAGWAWHLVAFAMLATALFVYSKSVAVSLLSSSIACLTGFNGIFTPSYNLLSRDFLIVALSLRLLAACLGPRRQTILHVLSGATMFLASLCYSSLVGLVILLAVTDAGRYYYEKRRNRSMRIWLTCCHPANSLSVVILWIGFLSSLCITGAFVDLLHRLPMTGSFALTSMRHQPFLKLEALLSFLFNQSSFAIGYSVIMASLLILAIIAERISWPNASISTIYFLGLASIGALLKAVRDPYSFSALFCLISIVAGSAAIVAGAFCASARRCRLLGVPIGASIAATCIYTLSTYYFAPFYSWVNGSQGLPFCFAAAVVALLTFKQPSKRLSAFTLTVILSGITTVEVAKVTYCEVYRDGPIAKMTAVFTVDKLRGIKSTEERVSAIQSLYSYLGSRIKRGDALVVFDDAPMLYFILEAKPAYGLARALRYNICNDTLVQLNEEFMSHALPRYAIRTRIDVGSVGWQSTTETDYHQYPLNETVLKYYHLEKQIDPFEVWRRD